MQNYNVVYKKTEEWSRQKKTGSLTDVKKFILESEQETVW